MSESEVPARLTCCLVSSRCERREDDREDRASAASLVNQIAAMLAHDCLLYERVARVN